MIEVALALLVDNSQGVTKMSMCLPEHQRLLIPSDLLFIFEDLG